MPNGIKIAKFIGGIIEVGFLVSFVYEIGKEVGRKEQKEVAQVQDSSINMKEFIDILKNVDKNAVDVARMVK